MRTFKGIPTFEGAFYFKLVVVDHFYLLLDDMLLLDHSRGLLDLVPKFE